MSEFIVEHVIGTCKSSELFFEHVIGTCQCSNDVVPGSPQEHRGVFAYMFPELQGFQLRFSLILGAREQPTRVCRNVCD